MKMLIVYLLIMFCFTPAVVDAKDPASKSECVSMLISELMAQCEKMFGRDNPDMLRSCTENIDSTADTQCARFFSGDNFCSACTSECISQYPAGDSSRGECVSMCMSKSGCKN
ncbi:MAG: hypothetical protein ISR96_08305 [Nitrospira sp.]|nr:hypothetical protein [bacterium]MBL7049500.1 hypothetical protein [Nitrospira sp.]